MDLTYARRLVLPLSGLLALTSACSDDGLTGIQTSGADGGGSTSGTSGPDTATSPNPTTTAGTTGADDQGDTTGEPEESNTGEQSTGMVDPTGATTEATGSTTDSATDSSTGEEGNVVYSAVALPGGLDRIRIFKADLDNDRCTWVTLVSPDIGSAYPAVSVPMPWTVESVAINDVAAACGTDNPAMFGAEAALAGSGTITFGMLGGTGIYPCMVDIDASFDFAGMLPDIPPTDDMVEVDIPVTGC